jgi:hypothetical protein
MGEAKRKRRAAVNRNWMTGHIRVVANEQYCFGWTGTISTTRSRTRSARRWRESSAVSISPPPSSVVSHAP